jgi:hypothetical protein
MSPDDAVRMAIDNTISEGISDVFDRPFELSLLDSDAFRKCVHAEILKSIRNPSFDSLAVQPIHFALMPKARGQYMFRRCALIQPMDTIKYLALVLTVADMIEAKRIPLADRRVFSYRFDCHDGCLFSDEFTFDSFHAEMKAREAATDVRVVVHADIANFYDRLNLHRLNSTLSAIGAPKPVVRSLDELLLHWARRDSYGLPVGNNASRILAEAALIDIDTHMISIGADFIRFVDDYRFFAPDAATAQSWLYHLMHRLAIDGHLLNGLKTQVRPAAKVVPAHEAVEGVASRISASPSHRRAVHSTTAKLFKPRIGYGRVPRRFAPPKSDELPEIETKSVPDLMNTLRGQDVIEPEPFKDVIVALVAQKQWTYLVELPLLLRACPPFVDYVCDMLAQCAVMVPADLRAVVSDGLGGLLESYGAGLPECHQVSIVKVLGTKAYANKAALLRLVRAMPRGAGAYLGRSTFDALLGLAAAGLLSRTDAIDIREYFERADMWERRTIIKIVHAVLDEEEFRPWEKFIYPQVKGDPFSRHIARPLREESGRAEKLEMLDEPCRTRTRPNPTVSRDRRASGLRP